MLFHIPSRGEIISTGEYYVYILDVKNQGKCMFWGRNDIYYTGMTYNLERRYQEHLSQFGGDPFLRKKFPHSTKKLVYVERVKNREIALIREKQIKKLSRTDKEKLIDSTKNILMKVTVVMGNVQEIDLW